MDVSLPTESGWICPLLTDFYQISMALTYFCAGRQDEPAVFDLCFRKHPFGGDFTVFAGLRECLSFIENFRFGQEECKLVKSILRETAQGNRKGFRDEDVEGFVGWLVSLTPERLHIFAIPEGSLVYPLEPLVRVEAPLGMAQLLETTLLNLVNYPSLVATNALRYRLAAGRDTPLIEMGLRRAQGPDGAMSASRYCYLGGFSATSNVLASLVYGIPVKGTHAHAFVQSFTSLTQLRSPTLRHAVTEDLEPFVDQVLQTRSELQLNTRDDELAAFIASAQANPAGFLALVDTYDTLGCGVPNFCCVGIALLRLGYKPVGIRLDSGEIGPLSTQARNILREMGDKVGAPEISQCMILASSDITVELLHKLGSENHEIDGYGIGTHLVTCKSQPALGCVYKLVEIDGMPRIKISDDPTKISLPGRKNVHRLYGQDRRTVLDLVTLANEDPPKTSEVVTCYALKDSESMVELVPHDVEELLDQVWGPGIYRTFTLEESRSRLMDQLEITTFSTNDSCFRHAGVFVSGALAKVVTKLRE